MNKRDARDIAYQITARSLRAAAKRKNDLKKFPEIPVNITEAGMSKVIEEMKALADRLEKGVKSAPPIDGESS